MGLHLRYIKIGMVASIALFFTMVSFNNLTDPDSNLTYIMHTLNMDTTFQSSSVMWRAVTNPVIQKYVFYTVTAWEILTTILCWIGSLTLLLKVKAKDIDFIKAKKMAYIGLFSGFSLYMIGFMIIAGEWFCMWQSKDWNTQLISGLFISLIMFVMIFLNTTDE
jgi:predicted small integral membrane protein